MCKTGSRQSPIDEADLKFEGPRVLPALRLERYYENRAENITMLNTGHTGNVYFAHNPWKKMFPSCYCLRR
jgi:carbonic anhydrase